MKKIATIGVMTSCIVGVPLAASAQNQAQTRTQEQIYGSQLMTPQERSEYQARMRSATTSEERERIRAEHHERMQARAKTQGVTLPDMPPAKGVSPGGVGPGGGMGQGGGGGMGQGGGMGPDGGRR